MLHSEDATQEDDVRVTSASVSTTVSVNFKQRKVSIMALKEVKTDRTTAVDKPIGKPEVRIDAKYGTTLCLNPGARFEYQFGPAKAKLIVDNIAVIKEFVAQYSDK